MCKNAHRNFRHRNKHLSVNPGIFMSPPFYYVHLKNRNCEFRVNFSLYTNASLTMHSSDFVPLQKKNPWVLSTVISKKIRKIRRIFYVRCDRKLRISIYQRLDGGGFDLRSGIRGDYKGIIKGLIR